jgi:GT2 family glycosyltransferase
MTQPLIGIVTVTYNSADFLAGFIDSCARQEESRYRVYCIDNDSRDNTAAVLASVNDARWIVTLNESNVGVAEGNNQGVLQALNDGCEWVLLLNNDTIFEPDFLGQLVDACGTNEWRVVVPKIHFDEPAGHIWYGGGGFNPRRAHTGYHVGKGQLDQGQCDAEATVDYSPTCAMLIHRSVFYDVGLMDESYFVYFDDTDFCWRLRQAGVDIGYTAKTSLVHKVGGSTGGGTSPFGAYMTARNRLYFVRKFWGYWRAIAWAPVFIMYYLARYLIIQRSWKCFTESLRGTFDFSRVKGRVPSLPASQDHRPLLVLVTSRFPWPLDHGFAIRIHWMLRYLRPRFRLHLHVVGSAPATPEALQAVKSICENVTLHRLSKLTQGLNLLRCAFGKQPLQCAIFQSLSVQRALSNDLQVADAAISIAARTAGYLTDYDGPKFCDLADSVGQAYLKSAQTSEDFIWRNIYKVEGPRMLAYEQHVVSELDGSFLFNPEEAKSLSRHGRVTVVPHGVDPRLLALQVSGDKFADGVVLFGKMNYRPNVECALWFIQEVMPLLSSDIRLYIVGSQPDQSLMDAAAKNSRVVVTGFIEDPYPDIKGSMATICPIRMGGGIQNKVIESLSLGAVTLISPLAALAFDSIPDSGMHICDDARSWADKIHWIQSNRGPSLDNAGLGRDYARQRFSWEAYGQLIGDQIEQAIRHRSHRTAQSPKEAA